MTTYALLPVTQATYNEVRKRLIEDRPEPTRSSYEAQYVGRDARFGEILILGAIALVPEALALENVA